LPLTVTALASSTVAEGKFDEIGKNGVRAQ